MLAFLGLFQLSGKYIDDLTAFVVAAVLADAVRKGRFLAVGALGKFLGLEGKVTPSSPLLALGHMMSWYCHIREICVELPAYCSMALTVLQ